MAASMDGFAIPLCMTYLFFIFFVSSAADTISEMQSVKDGETIVSSGGSFEMGFFSPGNSKNRYVGIWYKKINVTTVVWVANREIPLTETSGVLKVTPPGILVLLNGTNEIIWSSNTSRSVQNPVAQLLETGNLVVKKLDDDSVEKILWQSFDYPGNTLLPDMKLGKNLLTGQEWCISSWKSDDDPSQGEYTYRMDTNGYPELVMRSGNIVMYRSGPWNGLRFSGSPSSNPNNFFNYSVVFNEEELYYSYSVLNKSVAFRRVLSHLGVVQRWTWAEPNGPWILYSSSPTEYCDRYAPCGVYSSCKKNNSPICKCLDKFLPRYPRDWSVGDWSDGCIRKKPFVCRRGDGFLKYTGLNSPDTSNSWYSINMTLEECMRMCSENCSCVAYSNLDMRGKRSGCLLWFDNLIDIKDVGEDGQDIYVRMTSSELEVESHVGADKKREEKIIVISALIGTILIFLCLTFYICKKRRQLKERGLSGLIFPRSDTSGSQDKDLSLPLFGLDKIVKATNNFSMGNKLGEGGYGPVYKGILQGGQDIAVKRLSRDSRQGLEEFKNEVIFIAKLQHRNLVKLLGCCIQGEERMLIYEYMPNKSLDSFIFDKTKCALLDWSMRFHIINGISRGLLYLHQDSRLRIIHRDLKTSNILLDIDMNPKISDFGLARSFGANETEANTSKVVGTYGYMSPEYAAHGIFSVKSDVFSFGVLVLEIISGKKNISSFLTDDTFNLLGHAWKLNRDGRSMELVDDCIITLCHLSEMLRSIHVALLCVQECRNDRPTMASVVLMLSSDNTLPHPKRPGFFNDKDCLQSKSSTNRDTRSSVNEITITQLLDGR